ncbi:ATP-binding protein [Nocardioides taihuensis]|uniref:histidine kinase n=1 Tax=Nocardioides taihuensis TaxID=1835606 RepID=A0ABW0BFQ8_9ACTN
MRLSLRARATLAAVLLFGATLAVASALLVSTLERHLTAASDELARARIHDLLVQAGSGELPATLRNVDDDGVAQVVDGQGRVVAASANIAGAGRVSDLDPGASYVVRTVRGPDDDETETYRLWAAATATPGGRVTVYLGNSLEAVDEASAALRRALWVGVPLVTLVLGLATWLVLGRALGRLDRIRAEVDDITEERLDRRVDGDGVPDEVGRLAATMNAMLARLEDAAQRQRDLVADVSHDLQGPLATQRVALELALADPGRIDADRLRAEVLGATGQLERLVGDLLVLAAADDGVPARPVPLDLDVLVLEEARRARAGATVEVDTAEVSAAPVAADPDELRRVVRNLLDNATTHAASRVEVAVRVDGDRVRLDVRDDGPGVATADREVVFERFHRGDPARSRGTGSGLGLAIVRSLVQRAGGVVELLPDDPDRPGARFRVELPRLRGGGT